MWSLKRPRRADTDRIESEWVKRRWRACIAADTLVLEPIFLSTPLDRSGSVS